MSRDDPHFRLRIPEQLRQRVADAASSNNRSMTAEIIARLEDSFVEFDTVDLSGAQLKVISDIFQKLANIQYKFEYERRKIDVEAKLVNGLRVGLGQSPPQFIWPEIEPGVLSEEQLSSIKETWERKFFGLDTGDE